MMMKIKNENRKVEDMGILLFTDAKNNVLGKYLNVKKLDFSIDSLEEVDNYIEKTRKNKKKLTEEEIKRIILRCGAYLGEAIRKNSGGDIIWISYEEGKKINDQLEKTVIRDITTHLILYDSEKKRIWFPLAKVYKFLEHGREDNTWAFAMVCLEEHDR